MFGVFEVLDVLSRFNIITDVLTLDCHYLRTDDVEKMAYGATQSEFGYLNLKAQSDLVKHLIKLITNPGSPEEAVNINSALKCLCLKTTNNTTRFYELLSEGLHRRMLFQKLSQIYAPLIEEIKINKDF